MAKNDITVFIIIEKYADKYGASGSHRGISED